MNAGISKGLSLSSALIFAAALSAQHPALRYGVNLGGSRGDVVFDLTTDAEGAVYVTGQTSSPEFPTTPGALRTSIPDELNSYAFVAKIDNAGQLVWSTYLGGGEFVVGDGIAVDEAGAVYITGELKGASFPTTFGVPQRRWGGGLDAFVTKISPDGSRIEWSTYLGGSGSDIARAITVDPGGGVHVTGVSDSPNFPTTAGAYQREPGGGSDVFIAKLAGDGSRLEYSTLVGGSGADHANWIAIGPGGEAYVSGWTDTIRALGPTDAYCIKLSRDGSELLYLKFVGGSGHDFAESLAVDDEGAAYLVGSTTSTDFPLTPDALFTPPPSGFVFNSAGFLTKLDPQGEIAYSTFSPDGQPSSVALGDDGSVTIAGTTAGLRIPVDSRGDLPVPSDTFDVTLTRFAPDGRSAPVRSRVSGTGAEESFSVGVTPDGDLVVGGFSTSPDLPVSPEWKRPPEGLSTDAFVIRLEAAALPRLAAVVHGASFEEGPVARGQLISVFGTGFRADGLVTLALDSNGRVANTLDDFRLLVNRRAAPLIFVAPDQAAAVTPFFRGFDWTQPVEVFVSAQGIGSNAVIVDPADAAPGVFTLDSSGQGPAAALNQDGSVNGPDQPAERGSIVTIYATGAGLFDRIVEDGEVVGSDPPLTLGIVRATVGGVNAVVHYAGAAPGIVAGVVQVNLRTSRDLPPGEHEVIISVEGATSRTGVTIWVR